MRNFIVNFFCGDPVKDGLQEISQDEIAEIVSGRLNKNATELPPEYSVLVRSLLLSERSEPAQSRGDGGAENSVVQPPQ